MNIDDYYTRISRANSYELEKVLGVGPDFSVLVMSRNGFWSLKGLLERSQNFRSKGLPLYLMSGTVIPMEFTTNDTPLHVLENPVFKARYGMTSSDKDMERDQRRYTNEIRVAPARSIAKMNISRKDIAESLEALIYILKKEKIPFMLPDVAGRGVSYEP